MSEDLGNVAAAKPAAANPSAAEAHEAIVASVTGDDERLAYRGVFQRLFVRPEIGAIVGAAAIWAFFWAVSREFGTAGGAASILDVSATLGIMAVAVSLLMIGGEFDLSSGAATGTFAIITILLVKDMGELGGAGLSLWLAIPLSLVAALGLGWANGTFVERTALPSFIVTLATFFLLRGFKLGFSKLMIDNLTVGRISEGRGRGYEFWEPIFAYVWVRNDHQLGARDLIYTIGVVGGLSLMALALCEMNFTRRKEANPAGVPIFLAGVAGVVGGILFLHNSDGVSSNTIGALIIAVSGLVAFSGFGVWRYARQSAGAMELGDKVPALVALGLGLIALGAVFAVILGVQSQTSVLDLLGAFRWPLILAAGAAMGFRTFLQTDETNRTTVPSLVNVVGIGAATAFGVYAFMFMTTEQGLRAILFGVCILAGLGVLAVAAARAGRHSPLTRGLILTLAALAIAAMAFFIRDQSASEKFRSELFGVLLATALVVLVWGVISTLFERRRAEHAAADILGSTIAKAGMVAIGFGMVAKLLFTTNEEIAAGIPRAQFRISILWFIGFTLFATWLLGRTKFGSWIFAVGGNKQAARQVGVPAARTKTQLFMIVAVAAWLVGLLLAFRLDTVQSVAGNGLEFEYIIAAVVGGTLLTGGYGSAFGASIGAVIMAMSKQGIPSARWNSDWRFAFLGLILLTAVIANNFIRTKAEASR